MAGLAGKEKKLPFGPGDVLSETTMLEGDIVQFNLCINRGTKAERAVNVEIQPDTFHQSNELREMVNGGMEWFSWGLVMERAGDVGVRGGIPGRQ